MEGALAQGVHCEAGPVDSAVGVHLASHCLVFLWHNGLLTFLVVEGGEASAGVRSV